MHYHDLPPANALHTTNGIRVGHWKSVAVMLMALLALAFAVPVPAQQMTQPLSPEPQRINFLIDTIAGLTDAIFIRNGSDYDASQAAGHMRLKLRYAGSKIRTAEDFILCCGTGSSMSGKPYLIRFHDGRVVESAVYLHRKLAEYDAATAPTCPETMRLTRPAIASFPCAPTRGPHGTVKPS